MNLVSTLRRQLAINGVGGTISTVAGRVARAFKPAEPDPWIEFDRRHGADTCGKVLPQQDSVVGVNWMHGQRYQGCNPDVLAEKLKRLPIGSDTTFIDFGSGKGRALIVAAGFRFGRVIGVEYCEQLHEVAQANLRKLGDERVVSIHADATQFKLPVTPLVLFLYNPFGPELMQQLITNVRLSHKASPRPIQVIYMGTLCRDQWMAVDFLHAVDEDGWTTVWSS